MPTFRFAAVLACRLQNGETATLERQIAVEADDPFTARDYLPTIAEETVHDAGSRWLSAPLDSLEVIVAKRIF